MTNEEYINELEENITQKDTCIDKIQTIISDCFEENCENKLDKINDIVENCPTNEGKYGD